MRHASLLALVCLGIVTSLGFLACGSSEQPSPTGSGAITEAKSAQGRDPAPSVAVEDAKALADGNAAFAFDLYGALASGSGNFFYSPFSTSIALAMTYAGARSSSEQQMSATLHFTLPQDKLHPAFNELDLELQKRNQAADPATGKGFQIHVANSLWGDKTAQFLSPFLDKLAVNYGAGMTLVDFLHDAESARIAINDWVSDKTEGKIVDLLLPDDVRPTTRLVLTNAIYFRASWKDAFEASATAPSAFHTSDAGDVSVPMMHGVANMPYAEGTDWQAVELHYQGALTGMTIVLPAPGKLDAVESALTVDWLAQLDASAVSTTVDLSMPKFSFTTRFELKDPLVALGMVDPFQGGVADFSGMADPKVEPLSIAQVIHKAFIGVDEKGTEAAAATAVIGDGGAAPTTPKEVVLDRPFLFFIRDYPTGAILFGGRVVDPTQS